MIHEMFVPSKEFEEILSGERTFMTITVYDRPIIKGDLLAINEIEDENNRNTTTGRSCAVYITIIDRNFNPNIADIMGFRPCILQLKKHPMELQSYKLDYSVPLATGRRKDGDDNAAD